MRKTGPTNSDFLMRKEKKTSNHVEKESSENFSELIRGIKPYGKIVNRTEVEKPKSPTVKNKPIVEKKISWSNNLHEKDLIEYKRPGVQDRVLKRLKRGTYPLNGQVDLHGLTLAEARIQLSNFLEEGQTQRPNCILIIHGKGLNSKNVKSILRPNVRNWLSQDERVLAFSQAPKDMGGEGATYTLLRGIKNF